MKRKLNRIEIMIVTLSAIFWALGIAGIVIGALQIAKGTGQAGLNWFILIISELYFITSPLLICSVLFKWSKKATLAISIVSLVCLNAAALSNLLYAVKKPSKKVETPIVSAEAEEVKPASPETTDTPVTSTTTEEPKI